MATFIIHIGTPRTATTTLQKHIFPKCKNKLLFSKVPFGSSAVLINKGQSIGKSDSESALKYVQSLNNKKEFDHYQFAKEILFPGASCLAHNPLLSKMPKEWNPIMKTAIKFLSEISKREKKDILISSERLCDTAASFVCRSRHTLYSWSFPIFPLCKLINQSNQNNSTILVTLREPLAYLKSKYLRTLIQRKSMGERYISCNEYIVKQAKLETNYPGTSAIAPAMHSTFVRELMKCSFLKVIGYKELIKSKDIFSLLGLKGEYKFSFNELPKENRLGLKFSQENEIEKQIKNSLKEGGLYNRILKEQLFE